MKISQALSGLWNANKNYFKSLVESRKINVQTAYDYNKLYEIVHRESQPCFVLSTGRCGTALLTKILQESSQIDVHHTPTPELVYYSKFAYENYKQLCSELKYIVDAARYEQIRNAFLLEKTFVETNNRITYFAYQLKELYPRAKFIHLIRHPVHFIKSGMARDWYTGKNPHDEGHIILNSDLEKWNHYSRAEKIAWLWNETNQFIEDFKSTIEPERIKTVFAEDLFKNPDTTKNIFQYLGLKPLSRQQIESLLKKPVNKGNTKKIQSFDIQLKDRVKEILLLSQKYNYF